MIARKTFISYKYSEALELRNKIIDALGTDGQYYEGERVDSPKMDDVKTETIKEKLKGMIYDTSVMIVIISPKMNESKWIEWEIKYALKEVKRKDRNSKPNRIIAVIQNNNGYSWFKEEINEECCSVNRYEWNLCPDIIVKNRSNAKEMKYACDRCKSIDSYSGSYISFMEEEEFLKDVSNKIEGTFNKNHEDYILKVEA